MRLTGSIISGEFDERSNEFSLQQVKHLTTETTINQNQLRNLHNYLLKYREQSDDHVITLYDQLPIRLNREEVESFITDLESIQSMYFD